jgi:hypothetical protein
MTDIEDLYAKLPERITSRIQVTERGCWIVDADPTPNGYMRIRWKGLRFMAHRLVFELLTGRDIRRWQLDHLCEVRACCNPAHLEPVSPKVNSIRKFRRRKKVP